MNHHMRPLVILSLGANQGDPVATLLAVMTEMKCLSSEPLSTSSLWQSSPLDCPPGSPLFVNVIVLLSPLPGETPESLLYKTQSLEQKYGRKPKIVLNEPRPVDIDMIAWALERRIAPSLILPHPRAHQRRFVLEPLAELLPDFILPGQRVTVAELIKGLPPDPHFCRLDGTLR